MQIDREEMLTRISRQLDKVLEKESVKYEKEITELLEEEAKRVGKETVEGEAKWIL